jgi:hypothetical protein
MSSDYTPNPKTPREHLDNCRFQLENVQGWMTANDNEVARIKAECLVRAAVELVAALSLKEAE